MSPPSAEGDQTSESAGFAHELGVPKRQPPERRCQQTGGSEQGQDEGPERSSGAGPLREMRWLSNHSVSDDRCILRVPFDADRWQSQALRGNERAPAPGKTVQDDPPRWRDEPAEIAHEDDALDRRVMVMGDPRRPSITAALGGRPPAATLAIWIGDPQR